MKYIPIKHEKLCTIELDIIQDGIRLQDKFEWNISNTKNNPLKFA